MEIGRENGWVLLGDNLFLDQIQILRSKVEKQKLASPNTWTSTSEAKRLRMIYKLTREIIPLDPSAIQFRLGKTLRSEYKHWRRAKFLQQYRLFFRYDSRAKIIIYSWFNDEETKRAYESSNDAYLTFEKMLDRGKPPTSWIELLDSAKQ